MKKIELSTKDARKMYGKDKVMDELLLANFTKEELTELPESWEEYCDLISPKEYSLSFLFKQEAERKLYLLMKEYNGEWVADWGSGTECKYVIERRDNRIGNNLYYKSYHFLAFPTEELRDKFLNNFRDLIEIYFEL